MGKTLQAISTTVLTCIATNKHKQVRNSEQLAGELNSLLSCVVTCDAVGTSGVEVTGLIGKNLEGSAGGLRQHSGIFH